MDDIDDVIAEIMNICVNALEDKGFQIYGYSNTYQRFTVNTDKGDIKVDFSE